MEFGIGDVYSFTLILRYILKYMRMCRLFLDRSLVKHRKQKPTKLHNLQKHFEDLKTNI